MSWTVSSSATSAGRTGERACAHQQFAGGSPHRRAAPASTRERIRSMSVNEITETRQYLTFKLGNEIFATDVAKVREVLDLTTITAIPRTPEFMAGVINLRAAWFLLSTSGCALRCRRQKARATPASLSWRCCWTTSRQSLEHWPIRSKKSSTSSRIRFSLRLESAPTSGQISSRHGQARLPVHHDSGY